MREPQVDEALAALAKELAAFYLAQNDIDAARGHFDTTLATVVEHAVVYAFRIGYRTRVGEESREQKVPS